MFDKSTCTKCSFNPPLIITTSASCLTCPLADQKYADFNFVSKNLDVQDTKSTQFSIYHKSKERYALHSENKKDNGIFCNQVSTNFSSTDLSTYSVSRISQESSEFNSISGYFKCSLNAEGENLRVSVAKTASADFLKDNNRIDVDVDFNINFNINIDEGFYDLHSENNEMETIQAQLEAFTTDRELYISQIASRSFKARKMGTIARWRRSTDFIYEGKPMVRNKIRMRKKRSLRGAV